MTDQNIAEAIKAHRAALAPLADVEWRQGRSNQCNLWARTGGGDWKADTSVGQLATPELAAEAVRAHNEDLARRAAARRGVRGSGWTGVQVGDGNTQHNVY
jgi:hypothetical protein